MKQPLTYLLALGLILLAGGVTLQAQELSDQVVRYKEVDNGGDGRYRAVITSEKSLPDHTIYRPRSVKGAARREGPLPILIWCNGACSGSSMGYERMLSNIASHGYVVVGIGAFKMTSDEREDGGSSERMVVDIINWLVSQEKLPSSDYYKAIDVDNIALAGHSCGGAQAIANCANQRVKTLLIMNAGMGGMSMGGASPQNLQQLHCPLIYMTGGEGDVAYGNARGDFGSIKRVPVTWADLPTAGHGGTYWNQYGGEFGKMALKWLDWRLKGYTQNARLFLKPELKAFPQWVLDHHNYPAEDCDKPYLPLVTVADTAFARAQAEETFAFGADVSLLTKQVQQGAVFYNRKGQKKSLMPILKELGMNSVRLSVLVNPTGGVANLTYVRTLASQAKAQGLNVLLDIHYSDLWANAGVQTKPAAWAGHDLDQLVQDVYDHTLNVVRAVNATGAKLKWVQVGNEVDNGLLWDDGRLSQNRDAFVRLVNSAYDAVKAVDANIQTVLHVSECLNASTLNKFFDPLLTAGAKWDIIGLTANPTLSTVKAATFVSRVKNNVSTLRERYGKPVMIVETAYYADRPLEANGFLCDFLAALLDAGASGLFYYEPEMTDDWNQGAWNFLDRKPSIALDAFAGMRHTEVPYVMNISWQLPPDTILDGTAPIVLPVQVSHIRDRVAQVELKSGKNTLATAATPPYTIRWEDAAPGLCTLHALATGTDDAQASTDTMGIIVGPAVIFTKSTMETEGGKPSAQHWQVDFRQPGAYQLVFRYRAETQQRCKLEQADEAAGYVTFPAATAAVNYRSTQIAVAQAGTTPISLTAATGYNVPAIDSLVVIPLEGQAVPSNADIDGLPMTAADASVHLARKGNTLTATAATPIRDMSVYNPAGQLLATTRGNGSGRLSIGLHALQRQRVLVVHVRTAIGIQTFKLQ